jgi:alanine dehydrogenase
LSSARAAAHLAVLKRKARSERTPSVLVLDAAAVRAALPPAQAIAAMRAAFAALSAGRARMPARMHVPVQAHAGTSLVMAAAIDDAEPQREALAVKVVSVYPRNAARGLAPINAAVIVLDPGTGVPLALLEGAALTALRTAAACALATDLLARADSRTLALFGAGVQARAHVDALCAVRAIDTVYCYSRTRARAEAMCAALQEGAHAARRFVVVDAPAAALEHADIVATTTSSRTPVFSDTELPPGVHVNAIGAYTPDTRELPPETVARATVVVDSREAAWQEAGDLIQPWQAGVIAREHVHAELGEIVLGEKPGRRDPRELTLFKSVGVAVQDAVAARDALTTAHRLGLGREIDW